MDLSGKLPPQSSQSLFLLLSILENRDDKREKMKIGVTRDWPPIESVSYILFICPTAQEKMAMAQKIVNTILFWNQR